MKALTRLSRAGTAVAIVAVLLAATAAEARFRRGRFNPRVATAEDHDGAFHYGAHERTTPTWAIHGNVRRTTRHTFTKFAASGHAFGINVVLYALTH